MTQPERDDEFEAFLKRRTVLPHGMSVDDKLEPPRALDETVLRKAREAIHAHQQSQRAPRWAVPLAIAATVLLCLSIVLNVSLNTNRPAPNRQSMTAANADRQVSESPADDTRALDSGSVTARRREAADERAAYAESATGQANTAAGSRAAAAPPSASAPDAELATVRPPVLADAQSPAFAPVAPQTAIQAREAERAPAAEPSSAPSQVASAPVRGAEPPSASSQVASAPVRGVESSSAPSLAMRAPVPAGPSVDAAAAAPAPPPIAKEELPPATLAANELEESAAVASSKLAKSKSDGPARSTASGLHPRDPKTWLKQIDALRAQGRAGQADAEMQRFRAAFPNYPVKPTAPDPSARSPAPDSR